MSYTQFPVFKKTYSLIYNFPVIVSFSLLLLSSCSSTKNVTYFQDLTDTSKIYTQVINGTYEVQIQPDDILQLIVNDINSEAAAPFNLGNANPSMVASQQVVETQSGVKFNSLASNGQTSEGYLVDKSGTIDFPIIGNLKVQGLTIPQVKELLKSKLDKYLQNPIINARLLNYKVTVLGEVAHPSTYNIPSERITIVDAIGMAGDLTIFGKRENILLVREEEGQRKFIRLNLNSSKIFQSPYYYLKQNDIVYVEPNKSKIETSNLVRLRYITIATSIVSLLVIIIFRIK